MRPRVRLWSLVCFLTVALSLGGCSPSYRKERLVETIQQICQTEYHFTVSARQVGQTLAVHLHHSGILQLVANQIGLAPTANELLGNVIEVIHRVVLSSDAPIQFYLVLISDPAVPGAYLTMVRYLEDVRRANVSALTPTEFFSRTIFDLKYVGIPGISLDQVVLNDIRLEQFLSWQLAKRIQVRLAEKLEGQGLSSAEVGPCLGEFRNGEFAFTLNVTPSPNHPLDDALIQEIFQDATNEIAHVLSDYRFDRFDAVRLTHPLTGRNLILPKTRLELFR